MIKIHLTVDDGPFAGQQMQQVLGDMDKICIKRSGEDLTVHTRDLQTGDKIVLNDPCSKINFVTVTRLEYNVKDPHSLHYRGE